MGSLECWIWWTMERLYIAPHSFFQVFSTGLKIPYDQSDQSHESTGNPLFTLTAATSNQHACKPERWLWWWRDEPFPVATIIALEPPQVEKSVGRKKAFIMLEIANWAWYARFFKTLTCYKAHNTVRKPLVYFKGSGACRSQSSHSDSVRAIVK